MRRRPVIAIVAVLALLGLLTFGLVSKGSSGPSVGDAAPVNSLPVLEPVGDGTDDQAAPAESLDDYRGKWVLVNFWASWCDPCREESPALEDLQRRYGGDDFTVLGIATRDLSGDSLAFVDEFGLSYPQLRDADGSEARAWGSTGVPENFLIDPEGVIRVAHRGPVDERALRETFVPHLAGGAADPEGEER